MVRKLEFSSIQFTFISINKVELEITKMIVVETPSRSRLLVEEAAP